MDDSTMGSRIAWALERMAKRETWLADQLGVNQGTVRRWILCERQPRIDQALPMADALGVSVRWLLSGHGEPTDSGVPGGGGPSRLDGPPRLAPSNGQTERRRGARGRRSTDAG